MNDDIDYLYEGYLGTPEGARIADILVKLDRYCQAWMHKDDVMKMKKEILVQIIDRAFVVEEDSVPYSLIE